MLVPVARVELPATDQFLTRLLKEELERPGASVVVAEGRCSRQFEGPRKILSKPE
jgi:hypothetical protein